MNTKVVKRKVRNLRSNLVFVVLQKAHDTLSWKNFLIILTEMGLNLQDIKHIYKNSKRFIKQGYSLSKSFTGIKNFRETYCLSPTLVKIYGQKAFEL